MTDSLSVRDNRTNAECELPITLGAIRATDLRQFSVDDEPLAAYDPGLVNTASCRSSITYIDGEKGILEYRGYPIDQLAKNSTYLETAYLLLHGELPTPQQLDNWNQDINSHRRIPDNVKTLIHGFRFDAHPMAMMMSAVASFHTFYPDSRNIYDQESRYLNILRLIGKMPTLAAFAYRHAVGRPFVYPDDSLNYTENFLAMLFQGSEPRYATDPRLIRALEVLFILHADHEQNCSTSAVRAVASAGNDPYTSVGAGIGALFGPLHGGANEAVLKMLREIGSLDRVPEFIEAAKDGKLRMMGFGHRVYKNYDPRAKIIKETTREVFDTVGVNPLLKIALELEKIALEDEYFVKRKLYPNVDFYSGLIYEALSFPPSMFTVLFAVPRTAGWMAQWAEGVLDPEQKISRPKQIYTGERNRDYRGIYER